jgi:hypothetical protein
LDIILKEIETFLSRSAGDGRPSDRVLSVVVELN